MKYIDYKAPKVIRFIDSLKNGSRRFPPSLYVDLTDHCFNRCMACGHWQREEKHVLNFKDYIDFVEKYKGFIDSICYGGGDPMAYPEINDIMSWHGFRNIAFGMVIAGHIPNKVNLEMLASASFVRVSLDAPDAETYERCRGKIEFDKILDGIDRAYKNGVNIGFGITLHKYNCNSLPKLFRLIKDRWPVVTEVRCSVIRHNKDMELSGEEIGQTIDVLEAYEDAGMWNTNFEDTIAILNGYKETSDRYSRCYTGMFMHSINSNGDIYPCCILSGATESSSLVKPLSNIKKYNWQEFVNFSGIPKDRLPEVCDTCPMLWNSVNVICEKEWDKQYFI